MPRALLHLASDRFQASEVNATRRPSPEMAGCVALPIAGTPCGPSPRETNCVAAVRRSCTKTCARAWPSGCARKATRLPSPDSDGSKERPEPDGEPIAQVLPVCWLRTTTLEGPRTLAAVYAMTEPDVEIDGCQASWSGPDARRVRPVRRSRTNTSERSCSPLLTREVKAIQRPSRESCGSDASLPLGPRTIWSDRVRTSRTTTSVRDPGASGLW
jgi:hypothetical protein